MSLVLELAMNILVACLLAATIFYCYVLNRRIQLLQNSKGELAELLGHFDESTRRATDSIAALQAASKKVNETIQGRIDKANFAIDDLNDMMAKAEKATDKIEASLAISKQKERLAFAPQEPIATPMTETPIILGASATSPISSLQELMDRVSNRSSSDPALRGNQKITPGMAAARPPSETEQDLMHALQQLVRG